jgi:hypothetical protein
LPQAGLLALRALVDELGQRHALREGVPPAASHAEPPAPAQARQNAAAHAAPHAAPKAGRSRPAAARPERLPEPRRATVPALDYFRDTWARQQVSQHLSRSLARPTDNAGPLNSHRLALRALAQMQALSPAYLARFVAYLDALSWVDQAAASVPLAPAAGNGTDKKRKPGRAKPGAAPTSAP